ncbi:MAG TPA: hypothetical protein VHA12_03610 [Candidatus Nanoarchaeia archaeon]|nr:hypothetical protein [Candidatus Nanoarchaeia archaeon]
MFNPLNLFKKKEEETAPEAPAEEETPESSEEENSDGEDSERKNSKKKKEPEIVSSNKDTIRMSTEIDKLKASIESFGEIRKATTEKMTSLSEQIGELRAMILDRDRTIQQLELKTSKSIDMVESVQPDKLMSGLQREDAKFEALKANLEGNEAIMERLMEELKEIRKKVEFFRGIEEIVKLSEEVRKELVDIKRVEATIHTQTDKAETIYAELRERFQKIELFNDKIQEIKAGNTQNTDDLINLKAKMENLVDKTEFDKLATKMQRYIDALKDINKSSALNKDLTQLKSILQNL